jgi:LPXTG-motif cell wall-anchored protein
VSSFTAAISLVGIGTAQADNGCGTAEIQHSVDGGQTWTEDGRINGDTPPATIQVRLAKPAEGCDYTVSLASYSAEGPTWDTSGTQQFLGWDTVTLNKDKPEATLDVSSAAPQCFGQIDLYGNGTKYDGSSDAAALPHYPNSVTPTNLITAWNGGHECQQSPSPSPSPSDETTSPTPSTSPSTDTPTPSTSPSTGTPSTSPSTGTPTPSTSPSTSAPAVGDTSSPSPSAGSTAPPTGTPSVPPASGGSNLAETGGNGTQTTAFAAGGAALLLAGGAAVFFTRRRHSRAH